VSEHEIRPPDGFEDLGTRGPGMTNFLHQIDAGIADRLKAEKIFCRHAGRDFHGDVWFRDGVFHESVYVFHEFMEHLTAPTMGELMIKVNDRYGWC
jgi:hypothetical protein